MRVPAVSGPELPPFFNLDLKSSPPVESVAMAPQRAVAYAESGTVQPDWQLDPAWGKHIANAARLSAQFGFGYIVEHFENDYYVFKFDVFLVLPEYQYVYVFSDGKTVWFTPFKVIATESLPDKVASMGSPALPGSYPDYRQALGAFLQAIPATQRERAKNTLLSHKPLTVREPSESRGITERKTRFILAEFVFANANAGAVLVVKPDHTSMTNALYPTTTIWQGNHGGALPKIAFDFFIFLTTKSSSPAPSGAGGPAKKADRAKALAKAAAEQKILAYQLKFL